MVLNPKSGFQACISFFQLLVLISPLFACDSGDDLSVQVVDSNEILSEDELLKKQAPTERDVNTFYFGFDLRASPQEDAAQYLPFLKYLEKETGYKFKLHFTPKTSTAADEVGLGNCQFAAMGATSFLYSQAKYGAKSLVRGVNHQGKAEYQSFLVAKPNSKIKNISNLRGRKLAFGSEDSTQGHLIPRIMLFESGISLLDLSDYAYTGSHQNCAEAVVSGNFEVCGMQDQLAKELASQGLISVIKKSSFYPSSGIVANGSVSDEVVSNIKRALLNFEPQGKHKQGLYNWDLTEMPLGFIEAKPSDYTDLRNWSIKLGFLKESYQLN